MNNNNTPKIIGGPSPLPLGHSVMVPQSTAMNDPAKPQNQGGTHYPGHFQLSEPQAQVLAQAQYVQAHAQAQAQAAHSKFQAHVQSQTANAGNVVIHSPVVSSPGTASIKRSNQKPTSRPSGSSSSNIGSLFKTMELAPAVRRKKRKLPEIEIPEKVAAVLPQCALYNQLLDFEARVDAVLARKKNDILDSLKNPPSVQRTLRIYVFNTFSNQEQTEDAENKDAEAPSWSLKIVGRILENGKDPVLVGKEETTTTYPKFSSFLKKITIYLDASLYPDNNVIMWDSTRSPVPREAFEVKRKGDKESTARIRLEVNHTPERFKLSPPLAELLGFEVGTRQKVLTAIWHYVKSRKLQNHEDNSYFTSDPPLQKVLGEEKMRFSLLSRKIMLYLTPLQPVYLEHRIKLSGNSPSGSTCYDLQVDVPFPLEKEKSAFLENIDKNTDVEEYDEIIRTGVKKINEHCQRRDFFTGFSQSPGEFINSLISSQSKDLETFSGDASRNAEKESHSDFYNHQWVEDAVIRYLNRKQGGGEGPGSA